MLNVKETGQVHGNASTEYLSRLEMKCRQSGKTSERVFTTTVNIRGEEQGLNLQLQILGV